MSKIIECEVYWIEDVERIINKSRLTLRRQWTKGNFPKPALVFGCRLGWKKKVIEDWIRINFND